MHELPLMAFTLLLQASVGMTLWLAFLHRHILITSSARPVMRPPLLLAFLAGAVGLLISTLHLGYPLNAMHALSHFSSSWLSREIIFGALYLALLGLSTLLVMLRKGGWQLLLMLAAVVGIVDVFCMAQVYIHTSIITWQHYNTLIMFLGTVGILGSALVAVFRISGILPQIDALRNGDRFPGSVAFVGSAVVDRGFNGKCDADSHIATCTISDAGTVKTHTDTKLGNFRHWDDVLCCRWL